MTRGPKRNPLRVALGCCALVVIGVLGLVFTPWGGVNQRAVVIAGQTFSLRADGADSYTWTLHGGRSPSGPGLVQQKVLKFSRGDRIELSLVPGLQSGDLVQAGDPLVTFRSLRNDRRLAELKAHREQVDAQRALLAAGERPEVVDQAQRMLDLATTRRQGELPELERVRALVDAGAGSGAELQSAELNDRVRQIQISLAETSLSIANAGARPEQVDVLNAELSAIDAGIEELDELLGESTVLSLIDGVVEVGGNGDILRVYNVDRVYLRAPLAEENRHRLVKGGLVEFTTPAVPDGSFEASIVGFSQHATFLNGRQVFWMSAEAYNPDGVLQPGMSGMARFNLDGGVDNQMPPETDAVSVVEP